MSRGKHSKRKHSEIALPIPSHHAIAYAELVELPPYSQISTINNWVDAAGARMPNVPVPERTATTQYVLVFSDGNRAEVGHRCLAGRTPTDVGDAYDSCVVVNDPYGETSRRHFEFGVTPTGQVWVMDLGSLNGTWMVTDGSSRQLQARIRQPLRVGDVLRFGSMSAVLDTTG